MRTNEKEGVIMSTTRGYTEGHDIVWYVKNFIESEKATLDSETSSDINDKNKCITFHCHKDYNCRKEMFVITIDFLTDELDVSLSYLAGIMNMYKLQGKFKKRFGDLGFSVKDYYLPY